ncbi:MASE1 domain-containing protein, partial [Rhizobium johnstonii]
MSEAAGEYIGEEEKPQMQELGTGISIWPPGGLFVATLILASRRSWPWWILAGCLAEMFSNFLWFSSPVPAAFLIYAG